jgi:hypothetical protein
MAKGLVEDRRRELEVARKRDASARKAVDL